MVEALILICALGVQPQACTEHSAEDVIRVKVPAITCGLAAQTIVAGEAGERTRGRQMKVICRGKDRFDAE